VVLREALDQPALGEVVPVGPVDLAPLASSLLCQGRLLGAPFGVPTHRWLIAAFCRQGSNSFPLVLLVARLATFRGGRLLGRVVLFGAALSLCPPGALVHWGELLGNDFDVVRLELPHQALVGKPLAKRHDDGGWRDAGNGVAHLAETLDVLSQRFAFALFYRKEISLGPRSVEGSGKVGDELLA
jgi:hypothetical protein